MILYKNIKRTARLATIISVLVGAGCVKKTNHEELGIIERLITQEKKFVAKGSVAQEIALEEIAAINGDAETQNDLGIIYRDGYGVVQNKNEALTWFRRAVKQGSSRGANLIGFMYLEGDGVPQDAQEANSWFLRASKLNMAEMKRSLFSAIQTSAAEGNETAGKMLKSLQK